MKGSKKAKKKNKKSKHNKIDNNNGGEGKIRTTIDSKVDYEKDDEDVFDDLTTAERKSLRMKKEREMQELEKIGSKSHRERVEEFNEKLGNLTEHNDIPRVRRSVTIFFFVERYTRTKLTEIEVSEV